MVVELVPLKQHNAAALISCRQIFAIVAELQRADYVHCKGLRAQDFSVYIEPLPIITILVPAYIPRKKKKGYSALFIWSFTFAYLRVGDTITKHLGEMPCELGC